MGDSDVRLLMSMPETTKLFAKALLPRRGRAGALPGPEFRIKHHLAKVDRLAAYDRVCSFELSDSMPATWLHVMTFPLQLAAMTDDSCPLPLAGLVHARNTMTMHRPVLVTERLALSSRVARLLPHRRGTMLEVESRVLSGEELVWEGTSSYLNRSKAAVSRTPTDPTPDESAPAAAPDLSGAPTAALWRLPADLGKQYAAVSGDPNPIHLSPLAARAFGFPRAIAHGMWTHARVMAALVPRLPDAYTVDVTFTKPVLLPSTVRLVAEPDRGGFAAALTTPDGSRSHLTLAVQSFPD